MGLLDGIKKLFGKKEPEQQPTPEPPTPEPPTQQSPDPAVSPYPNGLFSGILGGMLLLVKSGI